MLIKKFMDKKGLSIYRLAELSGVPYSTVSDICRGKTKIENCSAKTVYNLARVLDTSVEELVSDVVVERPDFENFKSFICQQVKTQGDFNFILDIIRRDLIQIYFNRGWEAECLYLIAMIDYLCRVNNFPKINHFDKFRHYKLKNILLPLSVLVEYSVSGDKSILREAVENAIPEFMAFNIIEGEIRGVA